MYGEVKFGQRTLQWRHNERDGVSNHQPHDCCLNRLFKAQIKENTKAPRHWPFVRGIHWSPVNSPRKGTVTRKMLPFDDVIMKLLTWKDQLVPNSLTPLWNLTRSFRTWRVNILRARENGRHFPDDNFKCVFLSEKVWSLIIISLKLVPKVIINNMPALVQIMAWRRSGDKPLSEPTMSCFADAYMRL